MSSPTSNTPVRSLILELRKTVASDCETLEKSDDSKFQEYSERWTDIGRQLPSAIVLPRSEEDILQIVRHAVKAKIPFVVKSGGGSEWSTIGDDGFVIDLSHYSSVSVDAEARTATIKGGITPKETAVRLAEQGLFTGKTSIYRR